MCGGRTEGDWKCSWKRRVSLWCLTDGRTGRAGGGGGRIGGGYRARWAGGCLAQTWSCCSSGEEARGTSRSFCSSECLGGEGGSEDEVVDVDVESEGAGAGQGNRQYASQDASPVSVRLKVVCFAWSGLDGVSGDERRETRDDGRAGIKLGMRAVIGAKVGKQEVKGAVPQGRRIYRSIAVLLYCCREYVGIMLSTFTCSLVRYRVTRAKYPSRASRRSRNDPLERSAQEHRST